MNNFKYKINEESSSQRYEREHNERKKHNIQNILTNNDYFKITNIIKENFTERNKIIDDTFIKSELSIVIKHVKIKHSHHMDSKYSMENYLKIKAIVGHKTR